MAQSKLMELTYYDPGAEVRLTAYADTLILDRQAAGIMLCTVRFGGYPEVTRAMADDCMEAYFSAVDDLSLSGRRTAGPVLSGSGSPLFLRRLLHSPGPG